MWPHKSWIFPGFFENARNRSPKNHSRNKFLNIHIIHDVFSHLRSGATSRGEDPPVVGPSALSLSRAGSEPHHPRAARSPHGLLSSSMVWCWQWRFQLLELTTTHLIHFGWFLEKFKIPSGKLKIAHRNSSFTYETWWFSIAMLVYQRVTCPHDWVILLDFLGLFWRCLDNI